MTEAEILSAWQAPLSPVEGALPQGAGTAVEVLAPGGCRARVHMKWPIADMLNDYAVFTFAVPLVLGGLGIDPVAEWANRHDVADHVGCLFFPEPLFRSLKADSSYWSALWFCNRESWAALRLHLANVSGLDRSARRYWKAFAHLIRMPDPVTRSLPIADPRRWVVIDAFGLSGTDGLYWVESGEVPYLRRAEPEAESCQVGEALLST